MSLYAPLTCAYQVTQNIEVNTLRQPSQGQTNMHTLLNKYFYLLNCTQTIRSESAHKILCSSRDAFWQSPFSGFRFKYFPLSKLLHLSDLYEDAVSVGLPKIYKSIENVTQTHTHTKCQIYDVIMSSVCQSHQNNQKSNFVFFFVWLELMQSHHKFAIL